jgi:hypothetical protein
MSAPTVKKKKPLPELALWKRQAKKANNLIMRQMKGNVNSMELNFKLKADRPETKTCYIFEAGERPDQITLYLKKDQVKGAGINPKNGITVNIKESKGDK